MIAIPIDEATTEAKSSKLFGNVPMFALYEPTNKSLLFIKNEASGNGIKTAQLLKEQNVTTVVYSYMGDGPFKSLTQDGIEVYFIGKEPLFIDAIVHGIQNNSYIKVDVTNATTYLDSGTQGGNCQCGCTHE